MRSAHGQPLPEPVADHSSSDGLDRFWDDQVRWWHVTFAVLWVVTVGIALAEPAGRHGRSVEIALLVVIAVVYAGWGARSLVVPSAWGWVYIGTAWAALIAIHALNPETEAWLLFFVLFPQMWVILPRWAAVVMSVVVVVGIALARWITSGPAEVTSIVVSSAISIALSVLLGLFTTRMVQQATERARTIDILKTTRNQLAAAERDRGIGEERERLSREIHDTLAQGFTSVLALTRAADAALVRGDIDTARQRLALVETTAADNLMEARAMVAELTPDHLQSRTLVEALARLVDALRESTGLVVELVVDGAPAGLGGATEVVLLRAAQEALANVRRHAGATRADVRLGFGRDLVTLTVHDDGRGFDPATAVAGFGLDGLRARAAQVGGRARIDSEPGTGTTVRVEVPR